MNIIETATTTEKRIPIIKMISPERDLELARINAHRNFLRDFGREATSDEEAFDHNRKLAEEIIAKCGGGVYDPIPLTVCKRAEA